MTALTQQNRVDAWFGSRLTQITDIEADYFTVNGIYFQGLLTHLAPITGVGNGASGDRDADNLTSSPTDQIEDWLVAGFGPPLTTQIMPCTLQLHTYNGPLGKGWVAVLKFIFDGGAWQRSHQVGPETHRTHDWALQQEPIL